MPTEATSRPSTASSDESDRKAGSAVQFETASDDTSVGKVPLEHRHHFEQVYEKIKQYGRYQVLTFILVQYIMLNAAGNYVFITFAALKPQCLHRDINEIADACTRGKVCPVNDTIRVFHSLYEDDFVCPNFYLPNHMQTMQAVGSGIGALLGGHLADLFGRKWVSYSGALLMCSFGMLGGLAPDWVVLMVAMFGMGLSYGILIDALMTLASETVGPKYRIVQTLAFQWSLAMQLASLTAWLCRDWRTYLLILNGICSPVLVLMLFWVESPRWLIQKRRYKQACESLNKIAWWNGCEARFTERDLLKMHIKAEPKSQIYSFKDLFTGKKLFGYSVAMIFSALTVELCVGVIIFDVQVLAGDPFLNVALYGALRLWTPFFVIYAETHMKQLGRRALFISSQCFSIVCYFVVVGLYLFPASLSTSVARTVFALIGGIVNSSIFFTVYKQYTIELYPTLMRAIAVGTFGVVERAGGALAPQLVNMNAWTMPGTALTITTLIMCFSLIAGCAVLPETRLVDMPDTQEDVGVQEREAKGAKV
ncbi:Solute carrier family 22 member 4 [Aphelenchoides fujianensis]|nr:Solute carrier family 22 member 4 [Aphelenchoides fujianensis]